MSVSVGFPLSHLSFSYQHIFVYHWGQLYMQTKWKGIVSQIDLVILQICTLSIISALRNQTNIALIVDNYF